MGQRVNITGWVTQRKSRQTNLKWYSIVSRKLKIIEFFSEAEKERVFKEDKTVKREEMN